MGAVSPWVVLPLVLGLGVALAAELYARRGCAVPAPLLPALGMGGWIALSLVPLPVALLEVISPAGIELRRFVLGESWSAAPLTLAAPETWLGLLHVAGLLVAFWLGSSVFASDSRQQRVADLMAAIGALLGIVVGAHLLLGVSSVYTLFPTRAKLVAPFINMNHLAALATLTALASLGAARGALQEKGWRLVAAGLSVGLILQSGSRGGLLGLGAGVVVGGLLMIRGWRAGAPAQRAGAALGLGLVGLLGALLAASRLLVAGDPKLMVYRDTLPLVDDYLRGGAGRFAFGYVFPHYQSFPEAFTVRAPESWPLSLLAELGLPGMLLGLVFLGLFVRALLARPLSPREQWVAAGLAGLLVHDLVDFSLDTAGVGLPAALVAGSLLPAQGRKRWPVRIMLGALLLILAGAAWAALHPPDRALRAIEVATQPEEVRALASAGLAARPADGYVALAASSRLLALGDPRGALSYVNRARYLIPQDPRGHLLAARALRRLGRSSQARLEYRAALEYRVALDGEHHPEWLDEALQLAPGAREVDELIPREVSAWASFAQDLAARQRVPAALALAKRLSQRHPEDAEAWLLVHRYSLQQKDFDAAEEAAAQLGQLNDPRGPWLAAQAREARGDREGAYALLREGVERFPKEPELWLSYGHTSLQLGDSPEALRAASQARALGVKVAESWALEGAALASLSRLQGASKAYQEALSYQPDSIPWRAALAQLYERMGRARAAIDIYQKLATEDARFQEDLARLRGE